MKIFENFLGQPLPEARFSSPIKITGFDKLPEAGANFRAYESKSEAEEKKSEKKISCPVAGIYKETDEKKIVIPLIIKADVSGSLEALQKEIMKLSKENIDFKILRLNVGDINEDDIKLAGSGSGAIVLGFRVKSESNIKQLADNRGVIIILFDIIYKINEWLEEEIKKRLPEAANEEIMGTAELIKVFSQEKNRQVVGGRVLKGRIVSGKYVKILRRGLQ